jgi:hypothetical protein
LSQAATAARSVAVMVMSIRDLRKVVMVGTGRQADKWTCIIAKEVAGVKLRMGIVSGVSGGGALPLPARPRMVLALAWRDH